MADYHWAIGVILAAFASIVSNLGLNLQKLTHLRNIGASEEAKKNYFKAPLWIGGLVMIIVGSVADFAALAFGAQSIIAPLGSLTLVSNVFFAPCLLDETLTRRDLFATFAIVVGSSVSVAFASHKDTIYRLETLFGFYEQARFGLYAIFIMILIGVLWFSIQYMEALRKEDPKSPEYLAVVKYHRFCYAAISGTIGAQSVLFAKCSAELFLNSLMGEGFLLSYYQTWMVLICLCSTIFLQIKWMNQGLQRFDALYIVPVFQTFWIIVSVISGLVFFGESAEMNSTQAIMFPVGIITTVSGVFFLSQRGVEEDEEDSEDDEETGEPQRKRSDSQPKKKSGAGEGGEGAKPVSVTVEQGQLPPEMTTDIDTIDMTEALLTHPKDMHIHKHRIIDSSVGFGAHTVPAGFLPSRAMTLSSSMRHGTNEEAGYDDFEDDSDGL